MNEEFNQTAEVPEPGAQRVVSRPKKRRKATIAIAFGMLVLAISASLWGTAVWRENRTVRRVFVEGNRIVPANELVRMTGITAGKELYAVDLNALEEAILKQFYIRSVVAEREFPDAIRIRVEERQPIAAMSHGATLFFDEEGFVLPHYQSGVVFDVPFITGFPETQAMTPGQNALNPSVLYAVDLLKKAKELDGDLYHLISEIHVDSNGDVVLYSSDAGVTIVFGKDDEMQKLTMLRAFWKKVVLQRGADRLQLVDLRYADQVIARWKDSNNDHRTAF